MSAAGTGTPPPSTVVQALALVRDGRMFFAQGDFERARQCFAAAVEIAPNDAMARSGLARCQRLLSEAGGAADATRRRPAVPSDGGPELDLGDDDDVSTRDADTPDAEVDIEPESTVVDPLAARRVEAELARIREANRTAGPAWDRPAPPGVFQENTTEVGGPPPGLIFGPGRKSGPEPAGFVPGQPGAPAMAAGTPGMAVGTPQAPALGHPHGSGAFHGPGPPRGSGDAPGRRRPSNQYVPAGPYGGGTDTTEEDIGEGPTLSAIGLAGALAPAAVRPGTAPTTSIAIGAAPVGSIAIGAGPAGDDDITQDAGRGPIAHAAAHAAGMPPGPHAGMPPGPYAAGMPPGPHAAGMPGSHAAHGRPHSVGPPPFGSGHAPAGASAEPSYPRYVPGSPGNYPTVSPTGFGDPMHMHPSASAPLGYPQPVGPPVPMSPYPPYPSAPGFSTGHMPIATGAPTARTTRFWAGVVAAVGLVAAGLGLLIGYLAFGGATQSPAPAAASVVEPAQPPPAPIAAPSAPEPAPPREPAGPLGAAEVRVSRVEHPVVAAAVAPSDGEVDRVHVKAGGTVTTGEKLYTLRTGRSSRSSQVVTAPAAGRIERRAARGDHVAKGDVLAQLVDPSLWLVIADLSSDDLTTGWSCMVSTAEGRNRAPCRIESVQHLGGRQSRTTASVVADAAAWLQGGGQELVLALSPPAAPPTGAAAEPSDASASPSVDAGADDAKDR